MPPPSPDRQTSGVAAGATVAVGDPPVAVVESFERWTKVARRNIVREYEDNRCYKEKDLMSRLKRPERALDTASLLYDALPEDEKTTSKMGELVDDALREMDTRVDGAINYMVKKRKNAAKGATANWPSRDPGEPFGTYKARVKTELEEKLQAAREFAYVPEEIEEPHWD
jgi:hypothetical protein